MQLPHSLHSWNDETLSVLVLRRHHYNHTLVFGALGILLHDVSANAKREREVRDWYQRRLLPWTGEEIVADCVLYAAPRSTLRPGLQANWAVMETVWTPVNYIDDDDACRMDLSAVAAKGLQTANITVAPPPPEPPPPPSAKCGRLKAGGSCDCVNGSSNWVYCNEESGWCGDSEQHRQGSSGTYDCDNSRVAEVTQ